MQLKRGKAPLRLTKTATTKHLVRVRRRVIDLRGVTRTYERKIEVKDMNGMDRWPSIKIDQYA